MKFLKKYYLYLLAFLIPFLIIFITFLLKGVFGSKTILNGDMYAQYYPLYNYLKDVFDGGSSIFYSFNKGLGGTMYGTIFYYLSSPLNLLLFFVSKNNIVDFMTLLIVIKISLCGLTMFIYMSNKFKRKDFLILVFSLCYALMGYNINYYINIMWLDVVILSPIVLLGIDKIIDGKSPLFYIIFLFLSIFSNYYIAYMLCLFSILYFVYELLLKYNIKNDKKVIKKLIIKFLISSLIVGMLCGFFLIPCILESSNYLRNQNFFDVFKFDYNFFDLFSKTYLGTLNLSNTLNYSSMNLYCGIVVLPLVYLYFINRNINKKERVLGFIFLLILVLPCFIYLFNYVWHLFTIPNFYSYRYSFFVCFLLIIFAFKSLINLNSINRFNMLLYLSLYSIISLYLIIVTCFGNYYNFLDYKKIWITLLFLFGYFACFYFVKKKNRLYLIISLMTVFELILNIFMIFNYHDFSDRDIINEFKDFRNYISDFSYYRYDTVDYNINNDSMLHKFLGSSSFLSTDSGYSMNFLNKFSGEGDKNLYEYGGNNFILDTLLGIKYIGLIDDIGLFSKYYKNIYTDNDYKIYENPYFMGLGFMVSDNARNFKYSDDLNLFDNSNILFNLLSGDKEIIYKKYNSTVETPYYISLNKDVELSMEIADNNLFCNAEFCVFDKGYKHPLSGSDYNFYYFDSKNYKKIFQRLKKGIFNIDYIKNNELKGHVNVTNDNDILYLSLPYQDGFSVEVDSKRINYFKIFDTFVGIELTTGNHDIKIKYSQPGLKMGICVSIASFVIGAVYVGGKFYE